MAFIRGRRLLEGGVYFTFPFPNVSFIGGRRLKEEIRYSDLGSSNFLFNNFSNFGSMKIRFFSVSDVKKLLL